jgi:hypothetical protein
VPTRGVKSQYKFESRSDGINPSSQLRSSDTLQPWVPTRGNKSQYDFESRSDGISQIQQLAQFDRLHFNNGLILFGSFVPLRIAGILPTPINDLLNRVATPPRFESSLM